MFRSHSHALAVRLLPALLASTVALLATRGAQAKSGIAIGADLDYTDAVEESAVGGGSGFNVRLGYKLDLVGIQLTPELGGAYHGFSGDLGPKFSQGIVGARLSFLKVLEPGIYAHLGYGNLSVAGREGRTGATADAGLTLDLTMLPLVDVGIHGGYNGMLKSENYPAFDSYVVGIHGALIF